MAIPVDTLHNVPVVVRGYDKAGNVVATEEFNYGEWTDNQLEDVIFVMKAERNGIVRVTIDIALNL